MKRLIRTPEPTPELAPYTVGILHPDGKSVIVRHVRDLRPLQAYFRALSECEEEAPGDEEPPTIIMKELMRDWPLLFVLDGHVEIKPVLTGTELGGSSLGNLKRSPQVRPRTDPLG